MSHTPAPWFYIFPANGDDGGVRDKAGYICFMSRVTKYPGQRERYENELKEREANAKLIAAAPELLEALKKCRSYLQDIAGSRAQELLTYTHAAIAKAEGK